MKALWLALRQWYWRNELEKCGRRRIDLLAQKIADDKFVDTRENLARRALENLNQEVGYAIHKS